MNEVCPGCGRHCALNEVRCDRGRAYVQTGVLPERNAHGEGGHAGHEGHEGHGGHGGRRHGGQGAEYRDLPLESKLAASIRELGHAMHRLEDRAQEDQAAALHREVFACLGEEEKQVVLTCMEKVCRSLHHREG